MSKKNKKAKELKKLMEMMSVTTAGPTTNATIKWIKITSHGSVKRVYFEADPGGGFATEHGWYALDTDEALKFTNLLVSNLMNETPTNYTLTADSDDVNFDFQEVFELVNGGKHLKSIPCDSANCVHQSASAIS